MGRIVSIADLRLTCICYNALLLVKTTLLPPGIFKASQTQDSAESAQSDWYLKKNSLKYPV